MQTRTLLALGLLILGILVLAGCAGLSKNQCLNAEYSVAPQTERYLAGRNEGLKTFCTYERGYSSGRAGHGYAPVCPLEAGFSTGYQRGREIFDLTHRLDQREAEQLEGRINRAGNP